MKKLISVTMTLMLLLAFVIPVSAKAPARVEQPFDFVFEAVDCGDFLILDHVVGSFTETTFFDKENTPIRISVHVRGVDHLYNSAKPSQSIEGSFAWNLQLGLLTGEEMRTGLFWHITAPHYGSLYFETGRWVWVQGNLEFQTGLATGTEDICAFLR